MDISPAPVEDQLMNRRGSLTPVWVKWFNQVYRILSGTMPSVSDDNGDADVTLKAGSSALTQKFATALTADRTVTLSNVQAFRGARFRVVREAGATGAFNIDVGPGVKTLTAAGQWAEVEYDGTAWIVTAAGSL